MNDTQKSRQKLIRFQQRRMNLDHSFSFLKETLASHADERIKNAAIVKAFEMTFELCWKSLKDFLEYKGITVSTPRDILKESFKAGYLEDGQTWIELLDHRNELVHIYNEKQAAQATDTIRNRAFACIEKLVSSLSHAEDL
jgi:nucleotidyltransferase substrate binding protein (TIGR01987 family)